MAKVTPPKAPSTLSALYVDGVLLKDLDALYQVNTRLLGGQRWDDPNQFWASPARANDSAVREVLEIGLNGPKWVNHFSFSVSHFPARMWLQYWDAKTKGWKAVKQRKNGKQVEVTITDSVPARIPEHPTNTVHRHPQHSAPGHWQYIEIKANRVKASRFRIVMVRVPSAAAPKRIGKADLADYSLAVKEFQCGFEALSRSDVPQGNITGQNVGRSTPFSSSVDLLGSTVDFSITEYKASDLLYPALQAQAGVPTAQRDGVGEVWKCEPQPVPNAVVNLYADARTQHGRPQVVDRFYLNPTTTGVACNLYYSNDEPDPLLGFAASDQALRFPATQPHGSIVSDDDGLLFPDAGPTPAYLDTDNAAIQVNTDAPWWIGLHIVPQFSSTMTHDRVFLDSPWVSVRWDGTRRGLVFGVEGEEVFRSATAAPFAIGQDLPVLVSFDGAGTYRVSMLGWDQEVTLTARGTNVSDAALADFGFYAHSFRLGGAMTDAATLPGFGGYLLKGAVIKQEQITPALEGEFFVVDPDVYLVEANLSEDDREYMRNSLLRIHPFFHTEGATSRNPMGAVGGPGVGYDMLTWTPIPREFRLHKGYLEFDPVLAKYFKFEFTNLSPQPYDSIEPISRAVRLFTQATIKESQHQRGNAGGADPGSGARINQTLNGQTYFSDQNGLPQVTDPNRSYDGYTPTEAYTSADPTTAARLADLNPAFRLQSWQQAASAPRFTKVTQHFYEIVKVEHSDKIAYSVGLSELRMYRTNQSAGNDAALYRYLFFDGEGLDTLDGWSVLTPGSPSLPGGGLLSGPPLDAPSVVLSEPLTSRRNVRAVQFATTQSDARQMLGDPDFTADGLPTWEAVGGARIATSEDLNSTLGSTVKVDRSIQGKFWSYLEAEFPTWDEIVTEITVPPPDPVDPSVFFLSDGLVMDAINPDDGSGGGPEIIPLTWAEMSANDFEANSFGGVAGTELVQPVVAGRLYGAARVYCPTALTSPLRVQIVTPDGVVLADEQVTPKVGGITEWFCAYQIKTEQPVLDPGVEPGIAITWGNIDGIDYQDLTSLYGTWTNLETGSLLPVSPPVDPPPAPGSRAWVQVGALGTWSNVQTVGTTWSALEATGTSGASLTLSAHMAVPLVPTVTLPGTERHSYDSIEATSPSPTLPAWADVEDWGTWLDVQGGVPIAPVYTGPVSVRVIQDTTTLDTWYVDNVSLFEDSMIWEFSNDGGDHWHPAFDIRNDPNGVLLFPLTGPEDLGTDPGQALVWRLTTHRPDQHVTALWVKPWYTTLQLGVPHREGLNIGGPNLSGYDQSPAIGDLAPFKAWHSPVPQDWFFAERQWLLGDTVSDPAPQITPSPVVLSETLVYTD